MPSKIEAVIKSLPTKKKSPGPGGFTRLFIKVLMPILLKLIYKIETEGTVPNSFYTATTTLILKPHKDPQRNRVHSNFLYE